MEKEPLYMGSEYTPNNILSIEGEKQDSKDKILDILEVEPGSFRVPYEPKDEVIPGTFYAMLPWSEFFRGAAEAEYRDWEKKERIRKEQEEIERIREELIDRNEN
jgi:hypothetical protein